MLFFFSRIRPAIIVITCLTNTLTETKLPPLKHRLSDVHIVKSLRNNLLCTLFTNTADIGYKQLGPSRRNCKRYFKSCQTRSLLLMGSPLLPALFSQEPFTSITTCGRTTVLQYFQPAPDLVTLFV